MYKKYFLFSTLGLISTYLHTMQIPAHFINHTQFAEIIALANEVDTIVRPINASVLANLLPEERITLLNHCQQLLQRIEFLWRNIPHTPLPINAQFMQARAFCNIVLQEKRIAIQRLILLLTDILP